MSSPKEGMIWNRQSLSIRYRKTPLSPPFRTAPCRTMAEGGHIRVLRTSAEKIRTAKSASSGQTEKIFANSEALVCARRGLGGDPARAGRDWTAPHEKHDRTAGQNRSALWGRCPNTGICISSGMRGSTAERSRTSGAGLSGTRCCVPSGGSPLFDQRRTLSAAQLVDVGHVLLCGDLRGRDPPF